MDGAGMAKEPVMKNDKLRWLCVLHPSPYQEDSMQESPQENPQTWFLKRFNKEKSEALNPRPPKPE